MSWKSLEDNPYKAGSVWVAPSRELLPFKARPWSAMAMRAAHCGAASLVPPNCDHGAALPLL